MLIESLEQADREIKDRLRDMESNTKYKLFNIEGFGLLTSLIQRPELDLALVARVSFALGKGSSSADMQIALWHRACQCLVQAKIATFANRIFYPDIANPLQTYDDLMEINKKYNINFKY